MGAKKTTILAVDDEPRMLRFLALTQSINCVQHHA